MTGTVCVETSHSLFRSYLNHLVVVPCLVRDVGEKRANEPVQGLKCPAHCMVRLKLKVGDGW
jgi:hypothetical protein